MKLFNIFKPKQVRHFDGAVKNHLTSDWLATGGTADKAIKNDLISLRDRARDLERNDGYAESLFIELESNIIGPSGIQFKPMARKADARNKGGLASSIDVPACEKVSQAWQDYSKRGKFDVTGQFSRPSFERMAIRSVARDGGFLTKCANGFKGNAYGFACQGIEADALHPMTNDPLRNISMGIEYNEWSAPVAYHLSKLDRQRWSYNHRDTERVEVDKLIHLFFSKRVNQSQGFSWLAPVMTRLRHLSKYEESEVIAARASSNKIGFFERTGEAAYTGETDASGNIVVPSGPGEWESLPLGVKPHLIDPNHPNADYPDFRKAILRGVCAGIYVNYNTLAKDLEGVSFSSIRQGVLSERDIWRIIQAWFIDEFEVPVFEKWLKMALTTGQIEGLDIRDFDRLCHAEFSGRTWAWVDPVKDIEAAEKEIALCINSRQQIARDRGKDFDKILEENETDQGKMENAGLLVDANGTTEDRAGAIEFETLKAKFDAYGVGVRAGSITPQTDDENAFRKEAGLPAMSKAVKDAWKKDSGVRRPITLQSQEAFEATQEEVEGQEKDPPAKETPE